jgi:hypothetical protein
MTTSPCTLTGAEFPPPPQTLRSAPSAFGLSLLVPSAAFRLTAGEPRTWSRQTDSGRTLKGGSLDRPLDLSAAVHIWTSRKLSGVVIPAGATQFAEEPA